MTNRKYHWAIQVVPSMHPHAWRAHAGGYYAQACGRRKKSAVGYPAERFVAKSQRNPDWYCSDCARAARLALAKESAPKPADVVWSKPRPISEAPKDGSMVLICVPGCDPQWTIGVFDPRQCWIDRLAPSAAAVVKPTHFLPLPPSPIGG